MLSNLDNYYISLWKECRFGDRPDFRSSSSCGPCKQVLLPHVVAQLIGNIVYGSSGGDDKVDVGSGVDGGGTARLNFLYNYYYYCLGQVPSMRDC